MLPICRRLLQFKRNLSGNCAAKMCSSTSSDNPYPAYSNPESINSQSRLPNSEFLKFETRQAIRVITLDRPAALHALNYDMVNELGSALRTWTSAESVRAIVLRGSPIASGKRSFCAGGDVVQLFKGRGRVRDQCEFLRREYAMNHLISTSSKPVISLLDGFVFGGGAGISIHGQFRIATENTVFAMPETAIGFWPDVGASFFLPRLNGGLGYYLGLTGARLKGQDVYHAGLATHYIPSHRLDDVMESLSSGLLDIPNNPSVLTKTIDNLLNQFRGDLEPYSMEPLHDAIDRAFLAPNVSTIISRLKEFTNNSSKPTAAWAQETLNLLTSANSPLSPTAIQTTFALLQRGASATLKTAFRNEIALAQNYFEKVEDLYSGIDAKLIQKHGKPSWNPPKIEQVDQAFIKSLFDKPSDPVNIQFWNDVDFEQYPHQNLSLPTSHQIRGLLLAKYRNLPNREAFISALLANHFNSEKLGIKEHLEKIVNKHVAIRTELDKKGHIPTSNLNWIQ